MSDRRTPKRDTSRGRAIDPLLRSSVSPGPASPRPALPPPAAVPQATSAEARIAALAAARATSGTQSSGPGKVGRRAKPAKKAKLAALSLSALTSLALAGLFANQNGSTGSFQLTSGTAADPIVTVAPGGALAVTAPAPTAPATTAPATTAPATTAPATTAVAAPAGVLDGSYVGAGDSNRFGTVQVQVVYAGNSISDVQILNYPSGARTSVQINQYALPILINEAITGQTAKVSTVSGATYTSHSYQVSLQSAIDSAKAASGISG